MSPEPLILAMGAHVCWVALLYVLLTAARAPDVWGIGCRPDGSNPLGRLETRISANLSNQFEWPLAFYAACLLLIIEQQPIDRLTLALAWVFVVGRVVHSAVQIFTENIRLRGVVFTVNFAAVLALWAGILLP